MVTLGEEIEDHGICSGGAVSAAGDADRRLLRGGAEEEELPNLREEGEEDPPAGFSGRCRRLLPQDPRHLRDPLDGLSEQLLI